MEMSIEEHITQLKKLKSFHNGSYGASINYAIETMRKYKKIQEIVNRWNNTGGSAEESAILDYIEEVLKDGKIHSKEEVTIE